MTFTGKVALVAGGTGGLGRAVSLAFLREGAELIVTYRNDQEFADLKSVAGANASRLVGRHVDVTDEGAVQQLIAGIGAEGKGLDVLVNTVGGYVGGLKLWELDTRVLDQMLALNLRSGFISVACSGEGNASTGERRHRKCSVESCARSRWQVSQRTQHRRRAGWPSSISQYRSSARCHSTAPFICKL
jgi:NAD(P)-dependent dehydrogenase (short-subunit alcohol dehydrogenase family)